MSVQDLTEKAFDILQNSLDDESLSPQVRAEIALKILDFNGERNISPPTQLAVTAPAVNLPIPELYTLSESWQKWLVENKLRSVADQSLVDILIDQGIAEKTAKQIVFALPQEVSFSYIEPRWRSLQNYQLIATQYREQEALHTSEIARKVQVSAADFYQHYYSPHVPIVLSDLGNSQPWQTPATFVESFGDRLITPSPLPPLHPAQPNLEAIAAIASQNLRDYLAQSTPPSYVELDLHDWDAQIISEFFQHYSHLAHYLDTTATMPASVSLWLQSTASPFPLQAKLEDSFVVQLWGSSRWHIASPWQSEFLYGDESWVSNIDIDQIDLRRYPLLDQAQFHSVTLNAGEALFMPLLWWQQCRATADSGQIICTNFKPPSA
ncbi:MAG: cupin-like domain-containing protein [Limnothrix sp.]